MHYARLSACVPAGPRVRSRDGPRRVDRVPLRDTAAGLAPLQPARNDGGTAPQLRRRAHAGVNGATLSKRRPRTSVPRPA
ncbi:hypothetical protein EMIT0111MI5_30328 [Burkholderia sp. IT-111MI5]